MSTAEEQQRAAACAKSNLAYTFVSLGPEQREAMAIFYAFCREVDDITDDTGTSPQDKARRLEQWRVEIHRYYADGTAQAGTPLARDLGKVVKRFSVPRQPLLDIIDGVSQDVFPRRYANFEELRRYCYGVASAVGLVSIRIFECKDPQTEAFAEALGYALQMTNILRDAVEDYKIYGRVYLPQDEMRAYGVEEQHLADPASHPGVLALLRLQHFRAKHFFARARRLLTPGDRPRLKAALVMGAIYEDILDKIAARGFRITEKRVKLGKARKLWLMLRTLRELKQPHTPQRTAGRAAVLGAGVAGLAAAVELSLQGFQVDLFEGRTYAGGRAHSLRDAQSGAVLDNGQHVVMGCYHSFLKLVATLGVGEKLDCQPRLSVPYRGPGARMTQLTAAPLPSPFHLLGGLFGFGELSLKDRLAVLRFGLALRLGARPADNETAGDWLARHGQTPGAIRALWEPFCVAALNEGLKTASADLLRETLQRSLFGKPEDSAIYLSRVGLSELFMPEARLYIEGVGGRVHLGSPVGRLEFHGHRVCGLSTIRGEAYRPDLVVSALPWHGLRPLPPEAAPQRRDLEALGGAPIVNVHLITDRLLFDGPFVGLLDSPLHWIFDRTQHLAPVPVAAGAQDTAPAGNRYLYAITVSAAEDLVTRSSADLTALVRSELERFFPAARSMQVERAIVIKCKDATLRARPDAENLRPAHTTPWENLFLAGDWTRTGLPSTLESAALSAYQAVGEIDRQR